MKSLALVTALNLTLVAGHLLFFLGSAASPAASAATALDGGIAAIGDGNVHSVIETTTGHYARLWFKRAGDWIGHIGSDKR